MGNDIDGSCLRAAKDNSTRLLPPPSIEWVQSDFYDFREKVKQFGKIVLVSNVMLHFDCELASLWIQSKSGERLRTTILSDSV